VIKIAKPLDITGESFERLTAVRRVGTTKQGHALWLFHCACGGECTSVLGNVRSGNTTSCGCLSSRLYRTHGMNGTRLFGIYRKMIDRCYNAKNKYFHRYGGRGIAVCKEWLNDRSIFFEWAKMTRYANNLSIDRKNNDEGYSPGNCRWATQREQVNNRNNTIFITVNNLTKPLADWARAVGMKPSVVRSRLKLGRSPEDALNPNLFNKENNFERKI